MTVLFNKKKQEAIESVMQHQEALEIVRNLQEASGSIKNAQYQNNIKQRNTIQWL